MLCGAIPSLGCCLVLGLLVRGFIGSHAVEYYLRSAAIRDAPVRRELQSTEVAAARDWSQAARLAALSKDETARAQLAFIRGRQDSLPVAE